MEKRRIKKLSDIIRTTVLSIGENKGSPRIWQEGKYLQLADFNQGDPIRITYLEDRILITKEATGDHVVSRKRNVPVIDINNQKIKAVFDLTRKVQVIVRIAQIEIRNTYRTWKISTRKKDRSSAHLFSGGGLLDYSAKLAGFNTKWAVEINDKYADVWQANHKGVMHNCNISELDLDLLEPVELLTAGVPCEPFSIARQNQHDQPFHENAHLSMFLLRTIERVNPRTIILEEVPQYAKSEIGMATIETLKQMGYNVECKLLKGTDFGELMVRKRVAIVCTTSPNHPKFPKENPIARTMGEVLLSPEDTRCEWFTRETKAWLFEHWDNERAKGNNFQSQIITADTPYCSAITKRYFAQQGSNPVVAHPTKPDTFRWLTPIEVKRLMGLPDDYDLGETKTLAGEVLGQGVLVEVFRKVIQENKN